MKSWLFDNLGTKLMALLLAVLTWGYLYSTTTRYETLTVTFAPVLPEQLKDDLYIQYRDGVTPVPVNSMMKITIIGPRAEVERTKARAQEVACKPRFPVERFTDPEGNSFPHEFRAEDFDLPDIVRVETEPRYIEVRYEMYIEKEVEIVADVSNLSGNPDPGFRVKEVTCIPNRIRVRVPAKSGKDLKKVSVRQINIPEGTTATGDFPGEIDTLRPGYEIKPPKGQKFALFNVRVEVEHVPTKKTFPVVPLRAEGDLKILPRIQLDPTTIFVEVEGPRHVVEELKEDDIRVTVPIDFIVGPGADQRTKPATELRYYFVNREMEKLIKVRLMANKPEPNRVITIKVLEGKKQP